MGPGLRYLNLFRSERVQLTSLLSLLRFAVSQDPANYADAPAEGVRRILEIATGEKYPRNQKINPSKLESVRLSTTVATNALLERQGEKTALLITEGFEDRACRRLCSPAAGMPAR